MAGISKVQKVASAKKDVAGRESIGTCQCGGELKWMQVAGAKARMMQICEKCGYTVPREQ